MGGDAAVAESVGGGLSRRDIRRSRPRSARLHRRARSLAARRGARGAEALSGSGRGHSHYQHLHRHALRAGGVRLGIPRLRAEPQRRANGEGRRARVLQPRPAQAPFRRRQHGAHQQNPVHIARRERPRLPRNRVRRAGVGLLRAGARAAGRRRGYSARRNRLRYAQRQSRAVRH